MKKQTIYIASLEEVLNGRYYDIESLEDYQNAVENFLDICEKRNLSDDLEIQYIDGELTGEATDYIEDVLRLAEENEEELDIISALFKIFDIDEIEKILSNQNYYKYPKVIRGYHQSHYQSKEDAFREYLEETGYLCEVPERLRDFMDYEKLLYDFECRGLKFAETENEYIIVY